MMTQKRIPYLVGSNETSHHDDDGDDGIVAAVANDGGDHRSLGDEPSRSLEDLVHVSQLRT